MCFRGDRFPFRLIKMVEPLLGMNVKIMTLAHRLFGLPQQGILSMLVAK